MTEQEWLACDGPHWMLNYLRPWKKRERKMCLYVCASCRRRDVWDPVKEPCLRLLDMAERYADGLIGREEYKTAKQAFGKVMKRAKCADSEYVGQALLDFLRFKHLPGWEGSVPAVERVNYLGDESRKNRETMRSQGMDVITEEQAVEVQKENDAFIEDHTNLLRDIFGNPYRPFALNLALLTPKVIQLAQSIYDKRAFELMPELANTLEAAGCTNADILTHCRSEGPHVRGCWVVDLILGKT